MTIDPVSLAITVALTAANMAMTASRKIEGQRVEDLSVSVADYATPCNYFQGTRRFDGVPIIWAELIREEKKKRKTKGGKFTDYVYFGTWAVEVADHEIDAVTRMFFDRHLVYDVTGAGPPTAFSFAKGFVLNDHIRIYPGSETQMPDPRMQATIDAQYGPGSCPAYRGKAIIVFEEIPLEKFGNRIPQISVEATRVSSPTYPYTLFDSGFDTEMFPRAGYFDQNFNRFVWCDGEDVETFDVASRTLMGAGTISPGVYSSGQIAFERSGTFLGIPLGYNKLYRYSAETFGAGVEVFDFDTTYQHYVWVKVDGDGNEHWMTRPTLGSTEYFLDGAEQAVYAPGGTEVNIADYFTDQHGDIWQFSSKDANTAVFIRVVDTGVRPGSSSTVEVTGLASGASAANRALHFLSDTADQFVFSWGSPQDKVYAADIETGALLHTRSDTVAPDAFYNWPSGDPSLFTDDAEILLEDLSTAQSYDLEDWVSGNSYAPVYDPVNHAIIGAHFTDSVTVWRYLDRVEGGSVTLQDVVDDVVLRANIDPTTVDSTALTQVVRGYNWSQGSGRDILEPLLDIHDVDARPHGFSVQFVKRGAAAGTTIASENFAMIEREAPLYGFARGGGSDVPRFISMVFSDVDADQQPNSALVNRPFDAVDSARELTIDMNTLVLTVDEGRQLADRYLRRRWFDRLVYQVPLCVQQIALEPADVRTLSLPSGTITARLISIVFDADRSAATEWRRDDPSVAILSGAEGATMDGRDPSVILVPGPTKGLILDVTLAADVHDNSVPFLYYAAAPYGTAYWPGADIAVSDSGVVEDYETGWAAVASGDGTDWGYATDALGEALPWTFDEASVLNIRMQRGTLTSVTEAELVATGTLNLALLGQEWLQYRTATLQADGSYNLTGLLRGRRGSEAHIAGHAGGESFVPYSAQLFRREIGAGEIADFDSYRAVSQGRDIDSALDIGITFSAAANRPYSPVHGVLTLDTGSDDWSIDATRRTRIGGDGLLFGVLPLGEASESWEADVMDGATVVRTLTGTSLPLPYTSAQQVTDWGSNQTDLTVNLYQMSPVLSLRGFPLSLAA